MSTTRRCCQSPSPHFAVGAQRQQGGLRDVYSKESDDSDVEISWNHRNHQKPFLAATYDPKLAWGSAKGPTGGQVHLWTLDHGFLFSMLRPCVVCHILPAKRGIPGQPRSRHCFGKPLLPSEAAFKKQTSTFHSHMQEQGYFEIDELSQKWGPTISTSEIHPNPCSASVLSCASIVGYHALLSTHFHPFLSCRRLVHD